MPITYVKKSPRAPSITLKDAVDRAIKAYDRERLHEAPTEVVAQNIGYKNANSGTALSAMASLRYFGLLERPRNGFLAVAKDLEAFRFAATEAQRQALLIGFLTRPPLYQELLRKYQSGLPSDANLKYDLIERGFAPSAAETALFAFRESVQYANYFELSHSTVQQQEPEEEAEVPLVSEADVKPQQQQFQNASPLESSVELPNGEHDRIPVRLPGGRRAWLVIPAPFYEADRARLKAQIDLILAEDEDV